MVDKSESKPSSLLSAKQRQWLRGDKDVYASPDRRVRYEIKERLKQGESDLHLLYNSDEMTVEDLRSALRESTSSSNETIQKDVASEGGLDAEERAHILGAAFTQMEMMSGHPIEEWDGDFIQSLGAQVNQRAKLPEEWHPRFAVLGAYIALTCFGKTDKQVRQWIEHHWPNTDEALERLNEVEESLPDEKKENIF